MARKMGFILLSIIMAVIIASGCSRGVSVYSSKASFALPKDFREDYQFNAKSDFKSMELKLDIHAIEGSFTWKVMDPTGKEQWSGSVSKSQKFKETKDFNPMGGTWILRVEGKEVCGDLEVKWIGTK